ncbi:MAG: tRNA-dihydrouridine synthase family protein [Desulfamplus sp.]|nr:tRNA-dihydrouridine synthase family protein [Desulfamplus sp.]
MSYQIILAPLQGYTDAVFRDVYFRHFTGVDEAMSPFISTMSQNKINISSLKDVVPENNLHCPKLIPQILGNVAEDFLFLTRRLVELGYSTVNLNMGCPHSKVAKKKRGSGMLPYPEMVDQLLDNVFKGLTSELFQCKISIKTRLGRYEKDEIFNLLPIFERYPLEEIIVHPRTGVEMYGGNADVNAFIRVADNTSHNLVYNGDITSVKVFENIAGNLEGIRRYGQSTSTASSKPIKRFMIGRGILSNPFLPSEIKEALGYNGKMQGFHSFEDRIGKSSDKLGENRMNKDSDKLERIRLFHNELFATYSRKFYGPLHVTGRMKGFWTYIGPSFPVNRKEIKKILKVKNREHYAEAAEKFFAAMPVFAPDNNNLDTYSRL